MPGLFGPLFGDAEVDAAVSDDAVLQAMLDVESALAQAEADAELFPRETAEAISAACEPHRFDITRLGEDAEGAGNPVVPLVRALTAQVPPEARPWVHHGATSQDILDTAFVLVVTRGVDMLVPTLDAAAAACARLVEEHRGTLMVARTLGQQALPTTFGLKAAGWLTGLDVAMDRLANVRRNLAVQLGGAAGTLAAFGPTNGLTVLERLAARLGLAVPTIPWHTNRQRWLDVATALGGVVAAAGKVALDVSLMAQTEVGEVAEGGGRAVADVGPAATEGDQAVQGGGRHGGSSTLPHKRNPVDSVLILAAAHRVPGLVATLHATALHAHERATGAWHAEWEPLREVVRLTGSATARTHRLVGGLEVDTDRMRANLDATGGLVMAESVAARLAPVLGHTAAHDRVGELARAALRTGTPLRDHLLAADDIRQHLTPVDIDEALDPVGWLGSADALIDRALAAHRERTTTKG
ncbi:adenylosuccinate lyase family protein [Actinopolymorpha sp. B11F2]|uniref:class-II fumarase/aspartase family protein n=1 Tax=Actinopolymorpha sp. B11F2 TaxID=3160862 RepID=UPI0032E493EA